MGRRAALPTRFWPHVAEVSSGCWEWTAARDRDGYGVFRNGPQTYKAHRWAYEYVVAEIPAGLTLDHLCRNRACVNPYHLDPVPNKVNSLRGVGVGAINARKTHCLRGHAFDIDIDNGSERGCRTCRRDRDRESKRRSRLDPARREREAAATARYRERRKLLAS